MSSALLHLRDFAQSRYQEKLGLKLQDVPGTLSDWRAPVWQWHDKDLEPSRDESTAVGAVIADPEIGLCLLVQAYSPRFDPAAQIRKALQYRSELLPARNIEPRLRDEFGDWHIAMHWLVEARDEKSWIEQVSFLRQETAYFEEVPVDAIFNPRSDWSESIKSHGLPRLLFHVRQALKKKSIDESLQWASADSRIEEYIRAIPDLASSDQERRFSDQLVREIDRLKSSGSFASQLIPANAEPLILQRFRIENFRNIGRLEVELKAGESPVSSHVFQGPNGSGKSAIVEAISLSTIGISSRYLEYASDQNVVSRASLKEYLNSYLRPLGADKYSFPRLSINGNETTPIEEPSGEHLEALQQKLRCGFLSQLGRTDFLARSAYELGREVALSLSSFASQSFQFVERELERASERRKAFNRSWNIQPTITRIGTAQARILERVIDENLRPVDFDEWLGTSIPSGVPAFQPIVDLSESWQQWRANYRAELDRASRRDSVDGEVLLGTIGGEYEVLLEKSRYVLRRLIDQLETPPDGLEEIIQKFARWLEAKTNLPSEPSSESSDVDRELAEASRQSSALDERRQYVLARQNHLRDTLRFLERHWLKDHQDRCPTCETDLSARGGISPVLTYYLETTERTLIEVERAKKEVTDRIDRLSQERTRIARATRPVSSKELALLRGYINRTLGLSGDIESLMGDGRQKEVVDAAIQALRRMPGAPELDNLVLPHGWLETALSEYNKALDEFRRVSAAPDSWKALEKRLVQAQTTAVKEHLPLTVQALWREIALNLTAAPWQFPALAEMRVSSHRGETQARIVLEGSDALAAHILNGAEVYNLSLAWFLTRYLTTGRFQLGFFVLDDPAQQMDQPTFRDLCRLLESLLRLHRTHDYPLTILTFLHQDSRALDAARTTNGTLHLLRWNRKGTPVLQESMRMRQDDFAPPYPEKILAFG